MSRSIRSSSLRYASVIALSAALMGSPVVLTCSEIQLIGSAVASDEASNFQTVTTPDGATITGAKIVENGKSIVITGTGWKHPAGVGSVISVKADKGKTQKNGNGVLAEVTADAQGNFTLNLDFPSVQNSYNEDWAPGSAHTLHFLSGSGKEGDAVRAPVLKVQVGVPAGQPQPEVDTTGWTELKAADASLKVEPFTTGANAKLRMVGKGWSKADQKSGSVVAVKLASSDTGFFERSNNTVQNAYLKSLGQSELGDDHTAWILVTADKNAVNESEGIYLMQNDGSFDISVDAPTELKNASRGSYLAVQALSGRFAANDVRRSARSETIPVNGVAYKESGENTQQKCETVATAPTAKIANPTVQAGGKLHLVGSGWCNPEGAGAPKIAIKIDEAGISRIDNSVHSNKTIWAIIDPDEKTGEIDTWIQLPHADGSDSRPGLKDGAHSLRLLSGSLEPGDKSVTYGGVGVLDFVVGKYSPNAVPDTLSDGDLRKDTRNGVRVDRTGQKITVTVPGAKAGEWVQANPYFGGSVRSNWGSGWKQLDSNKQFSYELAKDLPAGTYKLAVQNGEQENFGALLGWAEFTQKDESQIPVPTPAHPSLGTPDAQDSQNRAVPSPTQHHAWVPRSISPFTNGDDNSLYFNDSVTDTFQPTSALGYLAQKHRRILQAVPELQSESVAEEKSEKTVKVASSSSDSSTTNNPADSTDTQETALDHAQKSWFEKILTPNNLLLLGAAAILLTTVLLPQTKDKK